MRMSKENLCSWAEGKGTARAYPIGGTGTVAGRNLSVPNLRRAGPHEGQAKYRLVDRLTYLGAWQPMSSSPAHRGLSRRSFWPRKGGLS